MNNFSPNATAVEGDNTARAWLDTFASVLSKRDIPSLVSLFLETGWLRDNLVFTWTHRSLCGHDPITKYLSSTLPNTRITNVQLEETVQVSFSSERNILEAAFTFETPNAYGRGMIMLQPAGNEWKALVVYMTLVDIKGHEERGSESGLYENHTKTWNEVLQERQAAIEKDPHVIILGAAQSGLNVGARFRQMDIPTLLIEQSDRVGDVWRNRYPSLTLHTPNTHHSMLYTRPATNAPKFTPRDKVATMLEQYAYNQDLVIWTRSTIAPYPTYDPESKRWTVKVIRNSKEIILHPFHIILGIGTLGKPYVPSLPGRELFSGESLHATNFKHPSLYAGKKTIVVGACQTSADICQDLATHGVASVMMVQRSSTVVASAEYIQKNNLDVLWPMHTDPLVGDFQAAAMPFGLFKLMSIAGSSKRVADQKEMLEGLLNAGLNVNEGPEGVGQFFLVFQRLGGADNGTADLIIQGKVKIKQGTEPAAFTSNGLTFKDGSTLDADVVIFATGYEPIKNTVHEIFGEDIANTVTPVWGLDEEGESIRGYKPSGHPGLWWAIGEFMSSRYYSKSLALQIKARELGMVGNDISP
ncbi:hypothetical protein M422DRAFT_39511 [Sphaerobolus stellatus SS14]|uniref:FAD/NAD(P)-binding domain-containing protein n=1 Tax=Sphaerobolus stellatus (strain SS14) TaxID=990650 RepID=A0A0C9UDV5_SPHS4|nr:hypothetical protein M422DRAFT_39511 [Sphaerobolus stellatus SS14]